MTHDSIQRGEYTLIVDGYAPITITVGENMQTEFVIEYEAVDEAHSTATNYDLSEINDGNFKVVHWDSARYLYLNDSTVKANEDVLVKATFRLDQDETWQVGAGFVFANDLDGDGAYEYAADTAASEVVYAHLVEGNGNWRLQFNHSEWKEQTLTQDQITALQNGTLEIGFARYAGSFYMLIGESFVAAPAFTAKNSAGQTLQTGSLQIGFVSDRVHMSCFGYSFTTGKEASDLLQPVLMPGGVYAVTNQDNAISTNKPAATITWNDTVKSIEYSAGGGSSGEMIWLDYDHSETFTYSAKITSDSVTISENNKLVLFGLRYGINDSGNWQSGKMYLFYITFYNNALKFFAMNYYVTGGELWYTKNVFGDNAQWDLNHDIGITDSGSSSYSVDMKIQVTYQNGKLDLCAGSAEGELKSIWSGTALGGVNFADHAAMRVGVGQNCSNGATSIAYKYSDIQYTTTVS